MDSSPSAQKPVLIRNGSSAATSKSASLSRLYSCAIGLPCLPLRNASSTNSGSICFRSSTSFCSCAAVLSGVFAHVDSRAGFAGFAGSRGGPSSSRSPLAARLGVVDSGRCHWAVYFGVERDGIEDGQRRDCSSSLRVTDAMLLGMGDGVVNFSWSRWREESASVPRANARRLCPSDLRPASRCSTLGPEGWQAS